MGAPGTVEVETSNGPVFRTPSEGGDPGEIANRHHMILYSVRRASDLSSADLHAHCVRTRNRSFSTNFGEQLV